MEDTTRKVKMLEATYKPDLNLFRWYVEDCETLNRITLAIPGEDFGIIKKTPEFAAIANEFCNKMRDKEFNLVQHFLQYQNGDDLSKTNTKTLNALYDDIKQFPIDEVLNWEGLGLDVDVKHYINQSSVIGNEEGKPNEAENIR